MDFASPYSGGGAGNFGPGALASVVAGDRANVSRQMGESGRNMLSLADMLSQWADKQKQIKTQASAARTFIKSDPDLMKAVGVSDANELDNMSSQDVIGAAKGVMDRQSYQKGVADTQEQLARAAYAKQQADEANFWAQLGQGVAKTINETPNDPLLNKPMTSDPNVAAMVSSMTPQQKILWQAVAQAGPGNKGAGAAIAPLVKSMVGGGDDAGSPFVVDKTTLPRWALVTRKGSHELQMVPIGGPETTLVDDGNGNQIPVLTTPRGNSVPLKTATTKLTDDQLLKSYDKQEAALHADITMAPDVKAVQFQKIDDARQAILARNQPAKKTDKATPPPAAATPAKVNEVTRMMKDGKKAVFNADTKEFIRYAD